jgi:hypothetical protein
MYLMFINGSEDCIEDMIDFWDKDDLIDRLKDGSRPFLLKNPLPEYIEKDIFDLICMCWSSHFFERPLFFEVVERLNCIKEILEKNNY